MKVAVIGSGLMGTGITQVLLEAGLAAKQVDINEEQLNKSRSFIRSLLDKKAAKGELTTSVDDCMARLSSVTSFEAIGDVDAVIEAVPEKLELKKQVFRQLDQVLAENTLIISNTSGLSISDLASVTKRPEKVMGMHFFFPVPKMGLVELIRGVKTSDETYEIVRALAERIGKYPVDAFNYPGFLVNRILVPMINEAIFCVMEGAKPEDVDAAMKLGANHPMGPIQLADFVGLDTLLATMQGLYDGFRDSKYRPCPLLVNLVEAGQLGRKTGSGFYKYDNH